MRHIDLLSIALIALGTGAIPSVPADAASAADPVVKIRKAIFTPQYGPGGSKLPVTIRAFAIDRVPVTRERYAKFLEKHPEWRKGKVSGTFAEEGYLSGWNGMAPPVGTQNHPVTHVSYFAAAAYCEWAEGRLPTVMEWEYVASAGKKSADGTKDPEQVAAWIKEYSTPEGPRPVGGSAPNFHGVQDLHGLVWEWTQDYNSSFVTADNRQDGEMTKNLFCGSGSMGAADRANYPAFMRYAMRGGLRPNYTIANQGFRCAYDSR